MYRVVKTQEYQIELKFKTKVIDIIEIERRLDDLFDDKTLNIELIAKNTHKIE